MTFTRPGRQYMLGNWSSMGSYLAAHLYLLSVSHVFLATTGPVVASLQLQKQAQGSEVPSLGTFSGTLSGKWAKGGKMGENGGK